MKEKNGISLIVLIVTIIVMIIIAGAIIISLTETNIIDQAEEAVEKHNESEIQAAANMAYSSWLANKHLNNVDVSVQNYIRSELVKQNVLSWEETSKYYITETGAVEEVDQEAFIYTVKIVDDNTTNTYKIEIDIGKNTNLNEEAYVYWGDGEQTEIKNNIRYYEHTYETIGIYDIKIIGYFDYIDLNGYNYFSSPKVIAIKSFGNLGLKDIALWYTINIQYMASPNEKSFENLATFSMTESNIEEIPEYFFKNCNKLELVDFNECQNLKSIPANIFEGVTNIENIDKTFPEGVEVPSNW